MRDSFIFYKSFYDAIRDLPRDVQGEIYTAIMEYSLYGKETDDLKPIARSIFTLMKPQIDKNNSRYENGKKGGRPPKNDEPKGENQKPNGNQTETKSKPKGENQKPNVNDNDNVNDNKKEISSNEDTKKEAGASSPSSDYLKFTKWIEDHAPYCANPKNFNQITEEELIKLKKKYTGLQVAEIIEQIENRKDLRKRYTNLYRTVLNWAKKEYGN